MRKGGGGDGRGRGLSSRFSLRRLLYSSPLVSRRLRSSQALPAAFPPPCHPQPTLPAPAQPIHLGEGGTDRISRSSVERASSADSANETKVDLTGPLECSLCLQELIPEYFPKLTTCNHKSCYDCFQIYLRIEILESRVNIACPQCSEIMHPNDIRMIVNDKDLYEKYEDFMVRRVLAVEPDTRWCPAPDCNYAVIATGCASCPKIKCGRPGCGSHFCYHCKAPWHPNQTCDAARAQRSPNLRSSSLSFSQDSQHRDDIKPCPRCKILIVKMDDGSCNHMTCSVCAAEFCWLCMKEISDLHYLSPSGCTFWGKKPWSRKKKILWQLGTLVGAPVGIGLVAGIAVPAIIIGIPVWVGRKLYTKFELANKHKRNLIVTGGVAASILVSPVVAGLAVSVGVPILLFYVYGVVPVSLCRSGGCGVTASPSGGVRLDFHHQPHAQAANPSTNSNSDQINPSKQYEGDSVSHRLNPSIGEVSLSMESGSQLDREIDKGSAVGLAGSITSNIPPAQRLEVQADVVSCQRLSVSSETASVATTSDKSLVCDESHPLNQQQLHYKVSERGSGGNMSILSSVDDQPRSAYRNRSFLNGSPLPSTDGKQVSGGESFDGDSGSERVRFDTVVSFIDDDPHRATCSLAQPAHVHKKNNLTEKVRSLSAMCEEEEVTCRPVSPDTVSLHIPS